MKIGQTALRIATPALLALVLLRALVPMGYMPSAAGSGFLFEMCHEAEPARFLAALGGEHTHGHHAHHQGADDESADESCAFGHLLSQAAIESGISLDLATADPGAPLIPAPVARPELASRYRQDPRGPPRA